MSVDVARSAGQIAQGRKLAMVGTTILDLEQIRAFIRNVPIVEEIERGFVTYSTGQVTVPPKAREQLER